MLASRSLALGALVVGWSFVGLLGTARAEHRPPAAQICSLGSAAVGTPGTVICKDTMSGETTQSIPVGATVSGAGGIANSLASRDERVLVTNQVGGAILFRRTGHERLLHAALVLHVWLGLPAAGTLRFRRVHA